MCQMQWAAARPARSAEGECVEALLSMLTAAQCVLAMLEVHFLWVGSDQRVYRPQQQAFILMLGPDAVEEELMIVKLPCSFWAALSLEVPRGHSSRSSRAVKPVLPPSASVLQSAAPADASWAPELWLPVEPYKLPSEE